MQKKDLNFKFKVWWIENRTTSFQPHQGFALLVVLEPVWSSSFLSIIPKIGKPWNQFSPISLVDYHFFSMHIFCTYKLSSRNRNILKKDIILQKIFLKEIPFFPKVILVALHLLHTMIDLPLSLWQILIKISFASNKISA